MFKIGLIREGKTPPDNRVALVPAQCRWIQKNMPGVRVVVQSSGKRCFPDQEYQKAGIEVKEDMSDCDILIGIKEVPVQQLIPGKTYLFFSHTKKKQPHNRQLLHSIIRNRITLVDYESLEHADGQRIIGFGFFAGVVGAHNGMMAYGNRTRLYDLAKVHDHKSFRRLIHTYFGLRLPVIKVAVTGSGRVASGVLEIMNLLDIIEVEPEEYLTRDFSYPVFVHLKGANLYTHRETGVYNREDFHQHPERYTCLFQPYTQHTDILMNGIYWATGIPRLFNIEDISYKSFRIQTIADITDDHNGSVPCNIGDGTIEDPVYGVNKQTFERTLPYEPGSVDIMAVSNLPNELPRDASRYFGEQLIKFVLEDLVKGGSDIIRRATMVENGILTPQFSYLQEYASED
ncbi:MAG TPA: NAD(P)-dependent oxidoreductase [Chitinophagaceae bacterium]|nr:NAD(P)-dependent oxidoreductase [Chitinophagaceae bacterium]